MTCKGHERSSESSTLHSTEAGATNGAQIAHAMQYYRELFTRAGVEIREGAATSGAQGTAARHIILVQTQGYVPVCPLRTDAQDSDDALRGWVRGGLTDTGGQTFYVLETAMAFARMGRRVTILAQRFGDAPAVVQWVPGVDIVRIPPAGIAAGTQQFSFVRKEDLYATIDPMAIDAIAVARLVGAQGIVGNYADGGAIALRIARALSIPMIFIAHSLGYTKMMRFGFDPKNPERFFAQQSEEVASLNFKARIDVESEVIRATDYIVSNSPEELEVFQKNYGIPVRRHEVLPAGVAAAFYRAQETTPDDDFPRQYGLTPGSYFVGWGRLGRMKNVPTQVEILKTLRERYPSTYATVKLAIVGGDPAKPEPGEEELVAQDLAAMLKKTGLKLGDDVVRIPSLNHERIAKLATHALGYVGTQTFEPFGMAAAENLAAGAGITVVSERAGIANWLKDRVSGVLIDPLDPADAASKIHEALADRARRTAMVRAGVEVAKGFTWDGIAARQAQILDMLRGCRATCTQKDDV